MNDAVVVSTKSGGYMFVIKKIDDEKELFFSEFKNEVNEIGTEEESQFWEIDGWVESVDDAMKFPTFVEAKAWADSMVEMKHRQYSIVLYGFCGKKGYDGSNWFPLKTFYDNYGEY